MGKLQRLNTEPAEAPKTPTKCDDCGWNFKENNEKKIFFEPTRPTRWRKEPRTQIRFDNGGSLCHTCYERKLFQSGEHRNAQYGGEAASRYRAALWPERSECTLTDEQKEAQRKMLADAAQKLVAKWAVPKEPT